MLKRLSDTFLEMKISFSKLPKLQTDSDHSLMVTDQQHAQHASPSQQYELLNGLADKLDEMITKLSTLLQAYSHCPAEADPLRLFLTEMNKKTFDARDTRDIQDQLKTARIIHAINAEADRESEALIKRAKSRGTIKNPVFVDCFYYGFIEDRDFLETFQNRVPSSSRLTTSTGPTTASFQETDTPITLSPVFKAMKRSKTHLYGMDDLDDDSPITPSHLCCVDSLKRKSE